MVIKMQIVREDGKERDEKAQRSVPVGEYRAVFDQETCT